MKKLLCIALSVLALTSCAHLEAVDNNVKKIFLVTENDIKDCKKLGVIDVYPRYLLKNARYDVKVKASEMGATHIVESLVYTAPLQNDVDFGVAISAFAFQCPLSARQSDNEEALIHYERLSLPHRYLDYHIFKDYLYYR